MSEIEITSSPAPEAVPAAYVEPTPVSAPLAPTPEPEKPATPAAVSAELTVEVAAEPTSVSAAPSPEPVSYTDHARANRDEAIAHLERLLADMPPVHSIPREYAETRSDFVFAIHNLKQGRK